jgi:hypothetical protein
LSVQSTVDHAGHDASVETDERSARRTLRLQIARLERELAQLVADGFPHLAPAAAKTPSAATGTGSTRGGGPGLLDLEQLERTRDQLVGELQLARHSSAERAGFERRSRELLQRMRLEPGRYRFVRLPARDLGEGGCGVWEVRPRLGLLGMLAGWWQVKLSSGCPLG